MDSSWLFVQEVENRGEWGIQESLGDKHERTDERNLGLGANHMQIIQRGKLGITSEVFVS